MKYITTMGVFKLMLKHTLRVATTVLAKFKQLPFSLNIIN